MNQSQTALHVQDLGRVDYTSAMVVQNDVHDAVLNDRQPPTLLLVEHDPVITVSQRRDSKKHLLASPEELLRLGIDVQQTNRGGDITYHGPGQLVAYPILKLTPMRMNLGRYMRWLERVVIDTLKHFDVEATTIDGCTGVWTTARSQIPRPQPLIHNSQMNKLCALGIRVRRNVTLHGLALNVSTNLDHFQTIVPCGIADRGVTSLQELLGLQCPAIDAVKAQLVHTMQARLSQSLQHADASTV